MKKSLIILLSILTLTVKAQTASQIIAKYVEFTGGAKAWANLKTMTTSGEYNYNGIKFPFFTSAKTPNLYKFNVPLKGKYFAQAYDGKNGWKIDAFKNETKPTQLQGKDALAMMNEADVELETPLLNYRQKGYSVTLLGKEIIDGKLSYKIEFIRKNGRKEYYFFGVNSSELLMKRALSKNSELIGEILDTYYADYKIVDGLKLPFKATSKLKDKNVLIITLSDVKINTPIEDKEFQF